MRLYHFLNAEYGLEAIGLRRLKISRIDRLNDPFEMLAGDQSDLVNRHSMRLTRDLLAAHLGIICFSSDWHNPVMWSHYADHHRGLCLCFDVDDEIAMPVSYVARRLPFTAPDHPLSDEEFKAAAGELARTKYSHWRYEKEVRCWASLDPDGPYIQFHYFNKQIRLRRVFIGAKSLVRAREIRDALGSDLENEVSIVSTRLAFRTFRVVTQRDARLWH